MYSIIIIVSQTLTFIVLECIYNFSIYQNNLRINQNKLGLSCAKLRPAWASYQLAFAWLAFTEAAYYA